MIGVVEVEHSSRQSAWQVVRFVIVGGWNTAFGYGLYAGLTYLLTGRVPHAYMIASAVANVIAIATAYVGHKLVTFRTKGNVLRELLRFYLVYGATALVGLALLPLAVAGLNQVLANRAYAPYVAQALLLPLNVALSFVGHKHFSFRPAPREEAP